MTVLLVHRYLFIISLGRRRKKARDRKKPSRCTKTYKKFKLVYVPGFEFAVGSTTHNDILDSDCILPYSDLKRKGRILLR